MLRVPSVRTSSLSRKLIENNLAVKHYGFNARTIRETPIRTIATRRQISVGEMLEVWSVDSLQEMLDTSPLQHPSQVMKAKPSRQYYQENQLSRRGAEDLFQSNLP